MQDLEWDGLRVFHAVSEAGSFAAAAQALGQHETTVARHVRRLERQLGHVLWRGPEAGVTDEGAALAKHIAAMAHEAAMARAALAGPAAPMGTVRVTTVPWVLEAAILPLWAQWQADAPGVTLSLVGTQDSLNLLHGQADVALRMARPETQGDVIIRKLGDVPFVVAGQGSNWIGYVPETSHLPQAQWTQEVCDHIALQVSDQAAATAAVQAGLGRAWVPECAAIDVDPAYPRRTRPLWCLTHPRTRNAPAVRRFCDTFLPLVAARLCR